MSQFGTISPVNPQASQAVGQFIQGQTATAENETRKQQIALQAQELKLEKMKLDLMPVEAQKEREAKSADYAALNKSHQQVAQMEIDAQTKHQQAIMAQQNQDAAETLGVQSQIATEHDRIAQGAAQDQDAAMMKLEQLVPQYHELQKRRIDTEYQQQRMDDRTEADHAEFMKRGQNLVNGMRTAASVGTGTDVAEANAQVIAGLAGDSGKLDNMVLGPNQLAGTSAERLLSPIRTLKTPDQVGGDINQLVTKKLMDSVGMGLNLNESQKTQVAGLLHDIVTMPQGATTEQVASLKERIAGIQQQTTNENGGGVTPYILRGLVQKLSASYRGLASGEQLNQAMHSLKDRSLAEEAIGAVFGKNPDEWGKEGGRTSQLVKAHTWLADQAGRNVDRALPATDMVTPDAIDSMTQRINLLYVLGKNAPPEVVREAHDKYADATFRRTLEMLHFNPDEIEARVAQREGLRQKASEQFGEEAKLAGLIEPIRSGHATSASTRRAGESAARLSKTFAAAAEARRRRAGATP